MSVGRKVTGIIRKLTLREVSLVDDGDNPRADVLIMKTRGPGGAIAANLASIRDDADLINMGGNMNIEELEKRLAEIEENVSEIEKARDEAVERADKAEARVTELEGEIAKSKDGGAGANADEDIFKGMSPKARERFEAMERETRETREAIEKTRTEREETAAIEIAKGFGLGNADDVGPALVRIEKGKSTKADRDLIEGILKQAATVEGQSALFKSVGSGAADKDDPDAILKAKAEEIQKANPGMAYHDAYTKAVDANPALVSQSIEKQRGRR